MFLMFPWFVTLLTNIDVRTDKTVIKFEVDLLVALITFNILTLIEFFKPSFSLNELRLNIFRELISTHGTSHSDIGTVLKVILIDSIVLYHGFSLMFNPKL